MPKHYYVTTAIDYINGAPHLGHAYEKIGADALVRYKRLAGYDTWFVVGSDEHSLNILAKAESLGRDPKDYCDEMAQVFKDAFAKLNISYSIYARTSSEANVKTAQEFIQRCYDAGYIYQGTYHGWYCSSCNRFYKEEELLPGNCCPVHNRAIDKIDEPNYFFKLSAFQDRLLEHYAKNPDWIQPQSRFNEMLNVIKGGLEDFSVSRSTVKWGVPVPFDPSQVIYVWFDALLDYVSGVGFADNRDRWDTYWPADVHVIGKDITRFHAIYWPAMLWAAGEALPKRLFAHGFINLGGEKLSKSSGVTVDPLQLADEYGADAVRYTLLREVPFDRDGDWSLEAFQNRYNADLANDLGNLVNRTANMIKRYFQGTVPAAGALEDFDRELIEAGAGAAREVGPLMEGLDFSSALVAVWAFIGRANQYLERTSPWLLARDAANRPRLETVLNTAAEAVRLITYLVHPFMPHTAGRIAEQLGFELRLAEGWGSWGQLPAGTAVGQVTPLFPRIEKE
ncbi:MAG TPA: methionine--tRNA ligase [Chloroflexota bacterium]|nr:methionine--tRNA ligase [Chloroflexota bacterium]